MSRLAALLPMVVLICGCSAWTSSDRGPSGGGGTAPECARGEHQSGGHCCRRGLEWVPARESCVCLAPDGCPEPVAEVTAPMAGPDAGTADAGRADAVLEPPPPARPAEAPVPVSSEAVVTPGCAPGAARPASSGGGCCRDGQYWEVARLACRRLPRCEGGSVAAAGRCVTVTAPGDWIAIAPGTFVMGSPTDEEHRFDDERQFRATLTHWFLLRSTEVSQGDFEAAMGYNPSRFDSCGATCPAERVSWNEAAAYCNALSRAESLEACYSCTGSDRSAQCQPRGDSPYLCAGYRLPTEAEWEYTARAGTTAERYGSPLEAIAWYRENGLGRTHPAGRLTASSWQLHDMLGNVDEWCHDWYGAYPTREEADPFGPSRGRIRVLRGGSWIINEWRVRAAYRYRGEPTMRVGYVGLRPARSVLPPSETE